MLMLSAEIGFEKWFWHSGRPLIRIRQAENNQNWNVTGVVDQEEFVVDRSCFYYVLLPSILTCLETVSKVLTNGSRIR